MHLSHIITAIGLVASSTVLANPVAVPEPEANAAPEAAPGGNNHGDNYHSCPDWKKWWYDGSCHYCPESKPYYYNGYCHPCHSWEKESYGHCCPYNKPYWYDGKCNPCKKDGDRPYYYNGECHRCEYWRPYYWNWNCHKCPAGWYDKNGHCKKYNYN